MSLTEDVKNILGLQLPTDPRWVDLAETYIDKEKVRKRWQEWLAFESELMQQIEVRGDRIH